MTTDPNTHHTFDTTTPLHVAASRTSAALSGVRTPDASTGREPRGKKDPRSGARGYGETPRHVGPDGPRAPPVREDDVAARGGGPHLPPASASRPSPSIAAAGSSKKKKRVSPGGRRRRGRAPVSTQRTQRYDFFSFFFF